MDLDRLRQAHRRANAPTAVPTLPLPVGGPYLVFTATPFAAMEPGRPARTTLKFRNVGDEDCVTIRTTAIRGVRVNDRRLLLAARSVEWSSFDVELNTFELQDRRGECSV